MAPVNEDAIEQIRSYRDNGRNVGNSKYALAKFTLAERETESGTLHKRERGYGICIRDKLFGEFLLAPRR